MQKDSQNNSIRLLESVEALIKRECRKAASKLDDPATAYEEFYAEGLVAVVKAAEKFDTSKNEDFANLAFISLVNCINRVRTKLQDTGYSCGVILSVVREFKELYGVTPTIEEIQDELRERGKSLKAETIAKATKRLVSMDSTCRTYSDDKQRPIEDCLSAGEPCFGIPTTEDFRWALGCLCRGNLRQLRAVEAFYMDATDKNTICEMVDCSMPTLNGLLNLLVETVKTNLNTEAAQVFIDYVRSGRCNFPLRKQTA